MFTIGQKIRKLREIKGIKQETVATALGITQAGYSKIELKDDIAYSQLTQIANIMQADVSEIINIDKNPVFTSTNSPNSNNFYSTVNEIKLINNAIESKDKIIALLEEQLAFYKSK